MTTQTKIEPLGHTIIALATPPAVGAETTAWIAHLDFVSSSIEQRPAILVVGFSDVDLATTWANQAAVKTSYRVVAACYHGATGKAAEIAAAVAAALADSADPALPFNGVNLGLDPVEPQNQLTFERIEQALHSGVCMLQTGVDGRPEIVRAISTYRINPDTGLDDDIVLDINGALTLDYTRKVMRAAAKREPRRKNTSTARRNLQSAFLAEALKLDRAEILKNVEARKKELVVVEDPNDAYRANARIPADWVRGMHVVGVTLDVY